MLISLNGMGVFARKVPKQRPGHLRHNASATGSVHLWFITLVHNMLIYM